MGMHRQDARGVLPIDTAKENWSVRQLDRQINTLFYDRLLASRDKKAVKEEISRTEPGRVEPKDTCPTISVNGVRNS